jgi:CO dehydrogenase/acetyl-CoA synthase gamma subunit (corrinoid Fe-S protein)
VQKIHQFVESDSSILDKIKGSAVELAKIILSANQDYRGQKFRAHEEFNILMRQATGIAKAAYVAEFVKPLIESGESVVLYGWHREVYSIWLERLAEYNPVLYTGTESTKEKNTQSKNLLAVKVRLLLFLYDQVQGWMDFNTIHMFIHRVW